MEMVPCIVENYALAIVRYLSTRFRFPGNFNFSPVKKHKIFPCNSGMVFYVSYYIPVKHILKTNYGYQKDRGYA